MKKGIHTLIELVKSGLTKQEICSIYKIKENSLTAMLSHAGHSFFKISPLKGTTNKRIKNIDELIEKCKSGLTQKEVAKHYGMDTSSVFNTLKKVGLRFVDLAPKKLKVVKVKKEKSVRLKKEKLIKVPKEKVAKIRPVKAKKEKVKGPYWTNEHDNILIAYNKETDSVQRSKLYEQLPLQRMVESILFKYFYTNLVGLNAKDLMDECKSHLVLNAFEKFNPSLNTKAYSYLGTCVKNYYRDYFIKKTDKNNVVSIESFYCENNGDDNVFKDRVFEIPDESKTLFELDEDRQELVDKARLHVLKLLSNDDLEFPERTVLLAVLELIKQSNYTKYYATYFLLKKTKYNLHNLCSILRGLKMRTIVNYSPAMDLEYYERKIAAYKLKNGITESNKREHGDFVKDCLNNLKSNEKRIERECKVQDSKQRLIEKRKKALHLKSINQNIG